MRHIW